MRWWLMRGVGDQRELKGGGRVSMSGGEGNASLDSCCIPLLYGFCCPRELSTS